MEKLFPRSSRVTEWFGKRFAHPTPAQLEAWPLIDQGHSTLIISPTGTGKTFAAFLGVLHQLALDMEEGRRKPGIQAVYISPLRALSYDLRKNLEEPLVEIYGSDPPIRVGLRSGDTSASERKKQFDRPPHILLTTPESLSLLLTQPKWREVLAMVRWVIVDELHALAENKRGAHLSLSLERLEALRPAASRPLQRIGLSATIAPAEDAARFLTGTDRPCVVVDASPAKRIDLKVYSPLGKDPYPQGGYTGERLIRELARLVQENRTTLVFTNTRSGAEGATYWLTQALPDLSTQIECHHASLDRDLRQEVEDRLKRGELRAVVCSTSLELGIDIGSVDLVVMFSAPKGVSKALQRAGRAGHSIEKVSRGLLMATNVNDLVECCATVQQARRGCLDRLRLIHGSLDVLAQHLAGMGCLHRWSFSDALATVRRAYPYRNLSETEFREVLDYLAGGGQALRQQYSEVFGKITLYNDGFETKAGRVQRDLLQNIGTIPSEGMVAVRLKTRTLGSVEESFLRGLKAGDVFMIGGRPVRLERTGMMECFVARADQSVPTVPRWNANKMPLGNRVAEEIVALRGEVRARFEAGCEAEELVHWLGGRLDCGLANARILHRMFAAQHRVSEIPTADFLLVEEYVSGSDVAFPPAPEPRKRRKLLRPFAAARHYFFHCVTGRAANDALSRVVALRLSRLRGGNAIATPDDYGFVLTVTPGQSIGTEDIPTLLDPEDFENDLQASLARSELLKYHFRNAAQTGLMVYRNFFGEQKSLRKMQWSAEVIFNVLQQYEPDHVLLREARREAMHRHVDIEGAQEFLKSQRDRPVRLRLVTQVPPLSFALFVTRIKEALLVEDPRDMMERLYHLWWNRLEGAEVATVAEAGRV